MNFPKISALCVLLSSVYSCQTMMPVSKAALSSHFQEFGTCWKEGGSVNFSAFRKNQAPVSATMDWIREIEGEWRWEIYDPIGRVLLKGSVYHNKIQAKGSYKSFLDAVQIKEDGSFLYDGSNLAIKWKELHCFLGLHLPMEWLDWKISAPKNIRKELEWVRFEEKDRSIDVRFTTRKTCGSVSIPFMGLFKRERYSWCFFKETKSGSIDFEKILKIEWTNAEEKENE